MVLLSRPYGNAYELKVRDIVSQSSGCDQEFLADEQHRIRREKAALESLPLNRFYRFLNIQGPRLAGIRAREGAVNFLLRRCKVDGIDNSDSKQRLRTDRARIREKFIGRDENGNQGRDVNITHNEALQIQHITNEQRIVFGMPLAQAIDEGYKITLRGAFEHTSYHTAQVTADTLLGLFQKLGLEGDVRILDLFTGTGQMAYVFAQRFAKDVPGNKVVTTVELDKNTFENACHNLELAGVASKVALIHGNALDILSTSQLNEYTAIYLDPPWNGAYKYDPSTPFFLSDMIPDGAKLAKRALKIAPIVVLKVPVAIDETQIQGLSTALNCDILIRRLYKSDGKPLNTTIYFIRREPRVTILESIFAD